VIEEPLQSRLIRRALEQLAGRPILVEGKAAHPSPWEWERLLRLLFAVVDMKSFHVVEEATGLMWRGYGTDEIRAALARQAARHLGRAFVASPVCLREEIYLPAPAPVGEFVTADEVEVASPSFADRRGVKYSVVVVPIGRLVG
jgi:hypothetical protein